MSLVTTNLSHPSLGQKFRFEGHDSSPFWVVNVNTRREEFRLAGALREKGGQQIDPRDVRVMFCSRDQPKRGPNVDTC